MKISIITYLASFVGVISISLIAGILHNLFQNVSIAKLNKMISGLVQTQPA